MDENEFRRWGIWAAQWGADYRAHIRERAVRPSITPGELLRQLPPLPPESGEPFETLAADFERLIVPGLTHWQHPKFLAYFPANSAAPSVIAEYLVAAISAQCMLWQTSPAATELETQMLRWMAHAVGLPPTFQGVIQDTASTATLTAVLTMRERGLNYRGNREGLFGQTPQRVYASELVHSSIDRAMWISGLGEQNLVRIPTNGPRSGMDPEKLRQAIARDRQMGMQPIGLILAVGGTSFGACDELRPLLEIAQTEGLFSHVDAAWAGAAMICPELRESWDGVELADSVVINPHKWLGMQFDCCTHFLKNPTSQLKTLAIHPEYLKTHEQTEVTDYSEWTIQLGRRFRALKMWFVFRYYGLSGLRTRLRQHIQWAQEAAERLRNTPGVVLVTAPYLSLFTFRLTLGNTAAENDTMTLALLNQLNESGQVYLSGTRVRGEFVIRFQVGQFDATAEDISQAAEAIQRAVQTLAQSPKRQ